MEMSRPIDSQSPMRSPQAVGRVDLKLYLAMLASHAVYGGLTIYLASIAQPDAPRSPGLAIPLVFIALATAGVAVAVDSLGFRDAQLDRWIDAAKQQASARDKLVQAVRQRALSTSIVRWAIAAMPSQIGLVAVLLGSLPLSQALLLVALGVLTHVSCRPKMTAIIARIDEKLPPPLAS